MDDQLVPSRRAILGTTVGVIGSGCLGDFGKPPSCPYEAIPPENKTGAIDRWRFSQTTSNQRRDGSCNRTTATSCLEVTLEEIKPDRIDRVVAKNADEAVVVSATVENQTEVYLELAELSHGDVGKYTISVIKDGEVIEQGSVKIDCSDE